MNVSAQIQFDAEVESYSVSIGFNPAITIHVRNKTVSRQGTVEVVVAFCNWNLRIGVA